MDDAELLAKYATDRSEVAFAELARRHVDLVYTAALRQLAGNHHLAQDVTQMVFVDLAKKAAALSSHPSLFAWLHRSTRYAVFNTRRKEAHRQALAKAWASDPSHLPSPAASWPEIGRVLDEVVDELPQDRTAVLLRFFAQKPFADIGRELGVSENAARMRLDRAVRALRAALERRGIRSTAAAFSALIAANAVQAAPASVAPSVAGAVAASGAPLSAWAGTLYTMSKIKLAVTAALVAAGATGLLIEFQSRRGLQAEVVRLRASESGLTQAQAENQTFQHELQTMSADNPEGGELARVRKRLEVLKARPNGVTDARLRPIVPSGRASPEAAFQTFLAAVRSGDRATLAKLASFRGGPYTAQRRADFMANFSEVIRGKHSTPEEVFAAAYYGFREGASGLRPFESAQTLSTEELFPGVEQVNIWLAGPTQEHGERAAFQQTPEGWSIVFRPLDNRTAAALRDLFDPATGLPAWAKQ